MKIKNDFISKYYEIQRVCIQEKNYSVKKGAKMFLSAKNKTLLFVTIVFAFFSIILGSAIYINQKNNLQNIQNSFQKNIQSSYKKSYSNIKSFITIVPSQISTPKGLLRHLPIVIGKNCMS